jgi:hypothetical protein
VGDRLFNKLMLQRRYQQSVKETGQQRGIKEHRNKRRKTRESEEKMRLVMIGNHLEKRIVR